MTRKKDATKAITSDDLQVYVTPEGEQFQGSDKAKNFAFLVYPTKEQLEKLDPECEYDGKDGYGTAPDDWKEQLRLCGFDFACSPLHSKDKNPDGTVKKPHWHIIVSWNNSTTYRNADKVINRVTNGTHPKVVQSVMGMYRYFNHLDNPEKYQYKDDPEIFNDFEIPVTSRDVTNMKYQLTMMCFQQGIMEYSGLNMLAAGLGNQWLECVQNNTLFFKNWLMSFKCNPKALAIEVLKSKITTDKEKEVAKEILNSNVSTKKPIDDDPTSENYQQEIECDACGRVMSSSHFDSWITDVHNMNHGVCKECRKVMSNKYRKIKGE